MSKGMNKHPQRIPSPKTGHKATHQIPRGKPRVVTVQRSQTTGTNIGYIFAVALILATIAFVVLGFAMLDDANSMTISSAQKP